MEGSSLGKLRLWEGWAPPAVRAEAGGAAGRTPAGPHHPGEFAGRLYACEALDPAAAIPPTDAGPEPYTLQWFLDIEHQRHGREGRWLPRLLEFAKHRGDTLLGLGDGLGTDWLQYA